MMECGAAEEGLGGSGMMIDERRASGEEEDGGGGAGELRRIWGRIIGFSMLLMSP